MKAISPAAERNKAPIFDVLSPFLPAKARVLEIASGTGQHADYFCRQRPDVTWQAVDPDPGIFKCLEGYYAEHGDTGFQQPVLWSVLDALPASLDRTFDAVVNINMIHISPWEACLALLDHTRVWLQPGGILFLYGPFIQNDQPTAPSNLAFHQSLIERDPRWGLRELERVQAEATGRGLRWMRTITMPANNIAVVFEAEI